MIVTTDIGNILYRDCKAFGIEVYQKGNIPDGEITTERVIIWTKEQSQETYWKKGLLRLIYVFQISSQILQTLFDWLNLKDKP
ncbi:hypothetical protein NXW88_24375 [Bacteroides cellulosilyticus]|nr:hypothetical protein NXW88_24375 [Bacteroides cellulosilyticus]